MAKTNLILSHIHTHTHKSNDKAKSKKGKTNFLNNTKKT